MPSSTDGNPLVTMPGLPAFSAIRPEHIAPAVDHLLADGRRRVSHVLNQSMTYTWDSLVEPLQALEHRLNRAWSPVRHLHSVADNEALRDAVELPSQLMENWCWEREALELFSGHYGTGAPLPDGLYQKLRSARSFLAGMQMLRQLEFALFDFRLHLEYDPARGARIEELREEVRREVAVVRPPAYNRLANGFSHIFAGGYGAGYYSYKWAEVLSSDAFARFEESGIFNRETSSRFLHTVLEQGGSRDAMDLFVEFRGREPRVDALLRLSGIAT